ncbi:MAG: DNA recombination protein RmuC [Synergistaceae bacterium]|nr:DNA recombination protein RmuC [Synergistaceae bacterium]
MNIIIIALLAVICVVAVIILVLCIKKDDGAGLHEELDRRLTAFDSHFGRIDSAMRAEFAQNRDESSKASRESREELRISLKSFEENFSQNVRNLNDRQREQYDDMNKRQDGLRQRIEEQLKEIRDESTKKLDEMRKTVDENLKDTVEKRFNDSFKLISERLEKVHQGLGEMQQLASGVGDLKRVLTNVKTKGIFGEIQLGSILEQILSPWQYEAQSPVRQGSNERVDYVIKLPDKNSDDKELLLPIDSKFPTGDYTQLLDTYDAVVSDDEMKRISGAFESTVKRCAKDIRDKYINPPVTTDFAIMFVPTEALYAEIVRRTELFENLQRTFKVTVVGPTNLAAFLNSLQMGFRTLAIERRSNEVWELLGAVKTEFGKFVGIMDKVKKRLDTAAREIDTIGVRSRAIERTLRNVEDLPVEKSAFLLADNENPTEIPDPSDEEEE